MTSKEAWEVVLARLFRQSTPEERAEQQAREKALAAARIRAHNALDCLWQFDEGGLTRTEAYEWLALEMRMPRALCHMSRMDEAQCDAVVEACGRFPGVEEARGLLRLLR